MNEREKDEIIHIQRDLDDVIMSRPNLYLKDEKLMRVKKSIDKLVFDLFVSQRK